MRVIMQEADLDELSGFTVKDLAQGIKNDFGFRTQEGTNSITVNITNDSTLKAEFELDDLGMVREIKSLKYDLPRDMTSIDLLSDESKTEELSAMIISATEVSSYLKEKLV